MNFSTAFGFLIAGVIFIGGMITATPNWKIFLDAHAAVIVIGGTIAATMVSFPIKHLIKVMKVIGFRILKQTKSAHIFVISEVVELAQGLNKDPEYLQKNVENIKTPFLKEAVQLQIDGGIEAFKMDIILKKRAEVHFIRYEDEAHIFKTVARFPPAFGLLGAVLGMVALLSGLGSPDSFKQIGPAMAMAMVATLYGIATANFIFVPLGENLSKLSKEDHLMRCIVIDSIKLLREKEHPVVVEEYLKSYLLSSERKILVDKISSGQKAA